MLYDLKNLLSSVHSCKYYLNVDIKVFKINYNITCCDIQQLLRSYMCFELQAKKLHEECRDSKVFCIFLVYSSKPIVLLLDKNIEILLLKKIFRRRYFKI